MVAVAVVMTYPQVQRLDSVPDPGDPLFSTWRLAWIAHQEDHHPDLEVGYNRCMVRYSTHTAQGLTLNDFICAARIDALLER